MRIYKNKAGRLKRTLILCGILIGVAAAILFVPPLFVSENTMKKPIVKLLEDNLSSPYQVGRVSFRWPDRIHVSDLTIRRHGQKGEDAAVKGRSQTPGKKNRESLQDGNREDSITFEDICVSVKLLSLLGRNASIRKISIGLINYENRLLIKDLVTSKFSFQNGAITTYARMSVNDGPTSIKGTVDLSQKKPPFDVSIKARGVHITEDVPAISLLPIFAVKDGEFRGVLSLEGRAQGKGLGKDAINKRLAAAMKLEIRDGYLRGNKLLSSISEMMGMADGYSFDSLTTEFEVKDGRLSVSKMDTQSPSLSLSATGVTEFEGAIAYEATVKFDRARLDKNIEKIAGLVFKQNELPLEIRGTVKEPKVSVKLPKNALGQLINGLAKDFLSTPKEKRKKKQ